MPKTKSGESYNLTRFDDCSGIESVISEEICELEQKESWAILG